VLTRFETSHGIVAGVGQCTTDNLDYFTVTQIDAGAEHTRETIGKLSVDPVKGIKREETKDRLEE
jgi:hypothetical protein